MKRIRELFSRERDIQRTIEKVIDYYEDRPEKLEREIGEYVVTDRLQRAWQQIIEAIDAGISRADAPEISFWVSGFYGSGKSSFTKYLGLALQGAPEESIALPKETPFYEKLAALFHDQQLAQDLRRLVRRTPATVVFLDLARDQLIRNAAESITQVLYAKVLHLVGYSKVPKLGELEYQLDEAGRYEAFQEAYRAKYPGKGEWIDVHDDPLIGPARGAWLVPDFYPEEFPTPESFRTHNFQISLTVDDVALRIVEMLRRKLRREVIVFVIDEVGQYVAPNIQLMLNLDGLVRSLKEVGQGKVWLVATAQQALETIVEKAIHNSAELFRLRDRFRHIALDAADIREITHKRLLTKSPEGEKTLTRLFEANQQPLLLHTRVNGFPGGRSLDAAALRDLYPFLPVHFEVVMELIRRLARRTGGTGLRSAIRVIQDLLVDPAGFLKGRDALANREVGAIATADDIYETLRNDLGKEFPHVIEGVERVARHSTLGADPLAGRVARAIAALQPLDDFPRTAENIAALLYPRIGAPPHAEAVREVLHKLVEARELGIVEVRPEDSSDAPPGYLFLSDKVRPHQQKRDEHQPLGADKRDIQIELLRQLFDPQPNTRLAQTRTVSGGLWLDTTPVTGTSAEVRFVLKPGEPAGLEAKKQELLNESKRPDCRDAIFWVVNWPAELDDHLIEACRSAHVVRSLPEHDADRDVAQFIRSEKRRLERRKEAAAACLKEALARGWFLFDGLDRAVAEFDADPLAAAQQQIEKAAERIFPRYKLAALNAKSDLAEKFLDTRLDRMSRERDPLGLVQGRANVQTKAPPLADVLSTFKTRVEAAGTGRLQGSFVQDLFFAPPFGWSKDTTRYLLAALLAAGEIELHTPEGVLRTAGPKAMEAFRSTASFNRIGLALRDVRPPLEALDRAARELEGLFGIEVLPLEDHISRAVRSQVPPLMERVGSLPDRLRLLGLPGESRAVRVIERCADLLREDAGGAASLLGAPDSPLATDIGWARSVVKCLDGDGEASFRRAAELRAGLAELASLFAEVADLRDTPALLSVADILDSETIFERLPDLRRDLLSVEHALAGRHARERKALEERLGEAQKSLAADPRWALIGPDDRAQLLGLLPELPPERADTKHSIAELRRLLTLQARLAGVLQAIIAELPRRLPFAQEPVDPSPSVQRVRLRDLVPGGELASPAEMDAWLAKVRVRLAALIELGPVRLVE